MTWWDNEAGDAKSELQSLKSRVGNPKVENRNPKEDRNVFSVDYTGQPEEIGKVRDGPRELYQRG